MGTRIWVFGLVTFWQCIGNGVVEQAMVAIAPWEGLLTDAQMFVFDEFGTWMFGVLNMAQIGVQHSQANAWEADEEGQTLPEFDAG